MRHSPTPTIVALLISVSPGALAAQTRAPATAAPAARPAAQAADALDEEEIVVVGQRPRGSVVGDIQPEIQLSPADVRSYGVSSISDLLDALAPQTGSSRGRGSGPPVVLLEGRRISGFGEIRDIPTEAISRVEILPEEVALKYGYPADQRVVNIVLRPFFRSLVAEGGGGLATEGGGENGMGDLNLLHIRNGKRLNLDAKYNQSAWLTESDRDVISRTTGQLYSYGGNVAGVSGAPLNLGGATAASAAIPLAAQNGARPTLADFAAGANAPTISDTGDLRTLRPQSRQMTFNGVYAQPIGKVSASINARYDGTRTLSLQGPPTSLVTLPTGANSPFSQPVSLYRFASDDALRQRISTGTAHGGLTLNGDFAPYRWTVTGTFDRIDTRTRTDRGFDQTAYQARLTANDPTLNPFARLSPGVLGAALTDTAHSVSNTGEIEALIGGPIATLPTGPINSTVKVGGTATGLNSDSLRSGLAQSTDLSRQTGSAQLNVDFPIASKRKNILPFLGELSANANAAVEKVSDFGTLTTYGYGLNWTPVTKLRLIASATHDQNAPTVQQLGNPIISTSGVRVFDYRQGTTVDVLQISGGNPALTSDSRTLYKLGAQFKPFTKTDLSLSANFISQHIRNQTANLPAATLEIEAAFPDRFTRTNGVLTRVDSRAVNFAREDRQTLRLGIDLSVPLKPSQALLDRQRAAFRAEFEKRRAEAAARGETLPGPPFAGQRQDGGQNGGQRPAAGQTANTTPQPGEGTPPPPPAEGGGPPPGGGFGGPPGGGPGGGFGPPGGGFGGPGGGRGGRGGNQAGGRLQFALYDNWTLKDEILIRPGVPVLDLLDGASVGSGGGIARHQLQLQLGYNNNGLGLRAEGNYNTGTTVNGGANSTTGDLRFSPLKTLNLRLFANLAQLPPLIGKDWARGARLTVSVNNLFNERQRVRDTLGNTPLSYQPAYLDALGRNVRITFRKLFFSIPRRPPQRDRGE